MKNMLTLVQPDRISVLYLQLLVNMNPEDAALRLSLAQQLIKINHIDQVHLVLEPLLNQQGHQAMEARLLVLGLDLNGYSAKAVDDPSRENELKVLQTKIKAIAEGTVPVDLFAVVIQRSLELEQPGLAAKLYERWASLDNARYFEFLREAGRWYIASGAPIAAAEVYNKAFASSTDPELAKSFALLASSALRAADKGAVAFPLIKAYLLRLPNDKQLLDQAISIALSVNDPKQALEWSTLRLALNPTSPEQLNKRVEIALATGALNDAFTTSERLLIELPKDPYFHERMAQIAEWNGKPDVALSHWIWLLKYDRFCDTAVPNSLRLAIGLQNSEALLEAFTLLSDRRVLSDTEFQNLDGAISTQKNSIQGISFLKHYLSHYPAEQRAWEMLAKTQENALLYSESVATWSYIDEHFGHPLNALVQQARLMRQMGKQESAFSMLSSNQGRASLKDDAFWQLFADLSWDLKRTDSALMAYGNLWKSGAANDLVVERLIQLRRDKKQGNEAVAIALEAYQRLKNPRWLLLAMDAALQFELWDDLRGMLQTAKADQQQFEKLEMYWLIQAQAYNHDKQPTQVLEAYQKALGVNPESVIAKEGVLWSLIDHDDRPRLARFLQGWQPVAYSTPALWGVYGIGLSKLGRNEQALPWFERKANTSRDDYLWLLTYADIMDKAGHVDAALSLRRYVLSDLRKSLLKSSNNPDQSLKMLQPALLKLIRDLKGADLEESVMQRFLSAGVNDPMVREMAIASSLSRENFDAARYWLLRAHVARQKIPVWQRLTLALADNDQTTLADILSNEGDKLTPTDRIEPLNRLNRTDKAIEILDSYLQTSDELSTSQAGLYKYRNELLIQQSSKFDLGWDIKSLGILGIDQSEARFTLPLSNKSLALQLRHNHLRSSDSLLVLKDANEVDVSADGNYKFNSGAQVQASVGANLKDQQSLGYGSVSINSKLAEYLDTNFRVGVHELSTETAALRAFGAKDKVSLTLTTKPTSQSFMLLDLDGHRYLTRQGTLLGDGYKVSAIVGYTLFRTMPIWQVRLQGSWESNSLKDHLPAELSTSLGSPSADIRFIVPKEYGTMGVGTTLRYGLSEQEAPRQPFLLIDAWIGWAWPSNVLAYNGRAGVGISLFRADVLSVGAFYGNVQGGQPNTAYQGIGAQYSIRF